MGTQLHKALLVTTWDDKAMRDCKRVLRKLKLPYVGPCKPQVNGYMTLTVCPDGSKLGWALSQDANDARETFKQWLEKKGASSGVKSVTVTT